MVNGLRYLLSGLLAIVLAGCGYHFTADSGTRLQAGQTVWVAYFDNRTVHGNASVALKRALFEQFEQQRGIPAAPSSERADLIVEGALKGYQTAAVSYSADDSAREYRLTIIVEATVKKRGSALGDRPLWKGTLTASQDYPVSTLLEMQRSSEDVALLAASRKLAQQLIWQAEQQY